MKPAGLAANYYFGGGGDTSATPGALCVLAIAVVTMLFVQRKYVIVPLILASLMINGQIVVAGAHLMVTRLLIGVGWVRMFFGGDAIPKRLTSLDKAVLAWAIANALAYTILWGEFGALFNRLGFLYSVLGIYGLLRYLLREPKDFLILIKTLVLASLVIAVFMAREHVTDHNGFSIFGAQEISDTRDGRVRAQGPFAHPIIAGTVGATLIPLFVGLWWNRRSARGASVLGLGSAAVIIYASASSTPVMTALAGCTALCFWPWRHQMRRVRWGIVAALIVLQLFMHAPIWFVLARLGGSMGGTGWHRAELIDQFVHHFGDWWLIGTRNNASWGLDMWDSINAYVNAGTTGGLVTFILFLNIFVQAYKTIGRARKKLSNDPRLCRLIWATGATLFANTVAFFGIIYFDQSSILWYALLSMISATAAISAEKTENTEQPHAEVAEFDYAQSGFGFA